MSYTDIQGVEKVINGENVWFSINSGVNNSSSQEIVTFEVDGVMVKQSDNIPKYNIDFSHVMKTKYEEGNLEINRIAFGITDTEGKYVSENPFVSIKYYDPDGVEITSGDFAFSTGCCLSGYYDSGTWSYGDELGFENYYMKAPIRFTIIWIL